MKEIYRVTMTDNVHGYYSGSLCNWPSTKTIEVEAEDGKEAKEIANKEVIGWTAVYVETRTAYDAFHQAIAERKAKEAAAKERRKATEKRKAEENGMTVEEYKKFKAEKAKLTRYKKEIEEMAVEIEEIKKRIAYRKRVIKEAEAKGII
jgi:hypothetical protein